MKNYKQLMAKVDGIIAQQDKKVPISSSGLLSPARLPKTTISKPIKEDSPEASIAKYVAMIRKQREGLLK